VTSGGRKERYLHTTSNPRSTSSAFPFTSILANSRKCPDKQKPVSAHCIVYACCHSYPEPSCVFFTRPNPKHTGITLDSDTCKSSNRFSAKTQQSVHRQLLLLRRGVRRSRLPLHTAFLSRTSASAHPRRVLPRLAPKRPGDMLSGQLPAKDISILLSQRERSNSTANPGA
jgi:hypothetical protein